MNSFLFACEFRCVGSCHDGAGITHFQGKSKKPDSGQKKNLRGWFRIEKVGVDLANSTGCSVGLVFVVFYDDVHFVNLVGKSNAKSVS